MKKSLILLTFIFVTPFFTSFGIAIDYYPPLTKMQGRGITLTSPDEKGWFEFNPEGKGAALVKAGPTNHESYSIIITYFNSSSFKSENEFLDSVKKLNTGSPNRFKVLSRIAELNPSRGAYFVNYYSLAEDYGARRMPKDQTFALLEIMGFYTRHPDDPTRIIKVEYSYRYYPGHEDPEFKKKAEWVLNQVTFIKP